jgi:hypothetical protein
MPLIGLLTAHASEEVAQRWTARERTRSRVRIALQAHAVLIVIVAAAFVMKLFAERSEREITAATALTSVALFLPTLGACAFAWRESRARLQRSVVCLAVAASLAMVAICQSGIAWTMRRSTGAEFARRVGRVIPHERELVMLGGNLHVLVYYADCFVHAIDPRGPRAFSDLDGAAVVCLSSQLELYGIRGRVVLREAASLGDDPMVLVVWERRSNSCAQDAPD